jgi:hypothetical protein
LLVEISQPLVAHLLHELLLAGTSDAIRLLACDLWPASAVTVDLVAGVAGEATLGGTRADGRPWALGLELRNWLAAGLGVPDLGAFATTTAAAILPPGGGVQDVSVRVTRNNTALAAGAFFLGVINAAAQDPAAFANYTGDFLQGHSIGAAASLELIDSLVLSRPFVQDRLRQALDPYTPDDPRHVATLSTVPPGRLRLSGSGVKHTPDCDIHIDWHVDLLPAIVNGFLHVRAEFDFSTSTWDVVTCTLGHLLLGALPGLLVGSFVTAIIGAFLNRPHFGSDGSGMSMSQCGDQCMVLTVPNPASADGRMTFAIDDRHRITITQLNVDNTGITALGEMTIIPRHSLLEVTVVDTAIHPTADSVCAGGPLAYQPASFTLYNPARTDTDSTPRRSARSRWSRRRSMRWPR